MANEFISDEELVENAQNGDKISRDKLLERYKGFVKSIARSYFLVGGQNDDLVQEGMIGLYEAIMDFSSSKKIPFKSFARLCIYRQIATAIRQSHTLKQKVLSESVSLDMTFDDSDEVVTYDIEDLNPDVNPEEIIMKKERISSIREVIENVLNENEKVVLKDYLNGLSYIEISEKVKKAPKAIDNMLYQIKKKIKKNIEIKE